MVDVKELGDLHGTKGHANLGLYRESLVPGELGVCDKVTAILLLWHK